MRPLALFAVLLPAAALANLNLRSPSLNHPELAIRAPPPPLAHSKRSTTFSTSTPLFFTHGIASGDPYSDSVILWTRAVPPGVNPSKHKYGASAPSACVAWEISPSQDFSVIIDQGTTETHGSVDYTVKVEARNLQPFTHYWYRFRSCGGTSVSPIGRTKTLPGEDDDVPQGIRLAIYSCANFAEGYFNAYGGPARRDSVDYVLHLGDYIYENPDPIVNLDRIPLPYKETISMRDYRMRIATARTDEDLLLSHATHPWIPVWDDHEVANNGWRSGLASPLWMWLEWTTWEERQRGGLRAYFEWMPLRQVDIDDSMRIWRRFRLGNLADLLMLDTRYYDRDQTDRPELINIEDRSIMGRRQEAWLYAQLDDADAHNTTWAVLGQQIQFSNINETAIGASPDHPLYYDGWAGYQANRARVLDQLKRHPSLNPVVLTGDYHTLWTADLTPSDTAAIGSRGDGGYEWRSGNGSLGIELAVTSVTSSNGYGPLDHAESTRVSRMLTEDNAFLKWAEGYYRGYTEVELTYEGLKANYYSLPDITTRNDKERLVATWECLAGEKRLRRPLPIPHEGAVQTAVKPWATQLPDRWTR